MEAKIHLFDKDQEFSTFTPGQVIFKDGEPGEFMYAVREGAVDIIVKGKVMESVGPGSVFGEMALVDSKPRSATAIAQVESKLVLINRHRFTFLVQQTPFFALQLMSIMADRIRRMDGRAT